MYNFYPKMTFSDQKQDKTVEFYLIKMVLYWPGYGMLFSDFRGWETHHYSAEIISKRLQCNLSESKSLRAHFLSKHFTSTYLSWLIQKLQFAMWHPVLSTFLCTFFGEWLVSLNKYGNLLSKVSVTEFTNILRGLLKDLLTVVYNSNDKNLTLMLSFISNSNIDLPTFHY